LTHRIQLSHSSILSILNTEKIKRSKEEKLILESELLKLEKLIQEKPEINSNSFYQMLLQEAKAVVAAMNGDAKETISNFQSALEFETSLDYAEPPLRVRSIRETAGQVFCYFGSHDTGVSMYQDAIKIKPNNGYALKGIIDCMHRKGDSKSAEKYITMLKQIWPHSNSDKSLVE